MKSVFLEANLVLLLMPWSGCPEQRLDKVERIKLVFVKGLQQVHLGHSEPPRGYRMDNVMGLSGKCEFGPFACQG